MADPKLNPIERACLIALAEVGSDDEPWCLNFRTLSGDTGQDRKAVRRAARSLSRKNLAQYRRGLFNDDGEVAGSGYGATPAGRALARLLAEGGVEHG